MSEAHLPRVPCAFWPAAAVVWLVDWATKYAAVAGLVLHRPVPLLGNAVRLTLAYDARRTFWLGIPGTPYVPVPGGTAIFFGIKLLILAAMLMVAMRAPRRWGALIGILAGAGAANTLEQIATGSVVNFLDVGSGMHRWPTFNLADAALVTTSAVLAFMLQREAVRERGWRRAFVTPDLRLPHSVRRDDDLG